MRSDAVTRISLAVLGGWLTIMPASVLTLALRMREFDPSGLPTQYSLTLAVGWLIMIVGLIGFGQLGDVMEQRGHSRVVLIRWATPLLPIAGATLMLAPTPSVLTLAWAFAQVPAAAILTSALAISGATVPMQRRGILSGLIGATSIMALLLGSVIVQLLQSNVAAAFLAPAILGALLVLPLALRTPAPLAHIPNDRRVSAPTARRWASAWMVFTVASFLLSWATSATNSYVVLFIDTVSDISSDAVAGFSTGAVIAATVAAVITSVIGGSLLRGRRSAAVIWVIAAVVVAVALVALLVFPTSVGILTAAIAFGAGFGLANGVELGLLLFVRHEPGRLGRDLGTFTAVTSAPYVLVPATATLFLAADIADGLRQMFALAALLAVVGAALTTGVALTTSRRTSGP